MVYRQISRMLWVAPFLVILGCQTRASFNQIATVQIIDKNGINEVISQPNKLRKFDKVEFLEPQPYQKVARVYKTNPQGQAKGVITTYHANGFIWQLLETVNGRARGLYKEWYPNGQLKIQTQVIEGTADICEEAKSTWVFDQESFSYRENGVLEAKFCYDKGILQGEGIYFHANGRVSKKVPYHNNAIHGALEIYDEDGTLIGTTLYENGLKNGPSSFDGNLQLPAKKEEYESGKLLEATYWDFSGEKISEISDGCGFKCIWEKGRLKTRHEYKEGVPEGRVEIYRVGDVLENVYNLHDGQKHGQEWVYYPPVEKDSSPQPLCYIEWVEDEIQGTVRTWYKNGVLESEKEIHKGKKNGLSLCWYQDESLMLMERYENDRLKEGKYFQKEEEVPVSRVIEGEGTATLFDSNGSFMRKISYQKGSPVVDENTSP